MTKVEKLQILNDELAALDLQISTIRDNGQSFSKGDSSGFRVEFSKLADLQLRKDNILNKIAVWELS